MSKIKPSIPRGTRDFGPKEVYKRNYIFGIVRSVFEKYGFEPLETPSMENLTTLTGKYGEEGDQLLFKVLNSGDYLLKADEKALDDKNSSKLSFSIAEKGLRYDLTIPFARYVVMHQNEIVFPFKRYQIQPVWRADRPQKGRYREFYQCDVDVVGSDSLLNEVELVQIYDEVFAKLKFGQIEIKLNNRKILAGIAEVNGITEHLTSFTVAIDKLDKIGADGVKKELEQRGIAINALQVFESAQGITDNNEKLTYLETYLASSKTGLKGVEEIRTILTCLADVELKGSKVAVDITLARGLNYYTGAIFEVKAIGIDMGSIGGGGRYDDLTGMFGLPGVSGVGISFGFERIYDVMDELNLFPENHLSGTKALLINFGGESQAASFRYLQKLRQAGIKSELYPADDKIKKQMSYADRKGVQFAVFVGGDEIQQNKLKAKNLKTGEENLLSIEQLIKLLTQE